ncbi:transposase [Brumimicrobium salinarum]|uniref:Transposase n=1 Tax=Brumimicrobium salinarum TaxID=2058658 RepID=A0A2I0R2R2_9FLAO|nr:transposase [Brumimicrobium salinarum]PKR80873.1 transposase [Brumimicrobium salinarum]
MSRNYRFRNPSALFFLSFSVVEWLDVFTRNQYKDILIDSLRFCQNEMGLEIYAWCIMTNHVHLVFRRIEDIPPGQLLGSFKRQTSMTVVKTIKENDKESRKENLLKTIQRNGSKNSNVKYNQFLRQGNKLIQLWSNFVIAQKIRYIHNNPVEQGLVFRPEDYPYSSAVDYSGEKGVLNGVAVVGF